MQRMGGLVSDTMDGASDRCPAAVGTNMGPQSITRFTGAPVAMRCDPNGLFSPEQWCLTVFPERPSSEVQPQALTMARLSSVMPIPAHRCSTGPALTRTDARANLDARTHAHAHAQRHGPGGNEHRHAHMHAEGG